MGFDTSGFVLKPARSAPSNATSTGAADSGVLREHRDLPGSYALPGTLVEVAADQYRAAVLGNPDTAMQEYLFWAANSSNLAILEDSSWAIDQGTGAVPQGSLTFTVGPATYTDGTDRIIVTDGDGRSIASVLGIAVVRGDIPNSPVFFTSADFASQDADAGIVTLDSSAMSTLGGGLSLSRGDSIFAVSYYLAAQKFWWTRNDSNLQRFGWDGVTQRWAPYKGSPPVSLGAVLTDGQYTLVPHPSRFAIGDTLPGNPLAPDAYAMVRVGIRPDATSTPMAVLVVSDDEAAETYSFPLGVDAVVGVAGGVLQWNPLTISSLAGRVAWYVPETYTSDSTGDVGKLLGATDDPRFITPIPGPTERPLIRLGSRRYLDAVMALTDADLASVSVSEGQVGWSLSTGKLKLSLADVAKSDPDDAGFEILYLGCSVVYDGVSLTTKPVGTRAPVQVVDSSGSPTTVDGSRDLFIPASSPLPSPGTSGVLLVPDGSGVVPNTSATPGTRPNGSGLVRRIGVEGDLILFGKAGAVERLEVVEFESDLPLFPFKLRHGLGMVARERSSTGNRSKLMIGRPDRRRLDGEPLYFLQAVVQPAVYADKARIISRRCEPFVLDGTEVLAFTVSTSDYLWSASGLGAGSFDAATVAASIDAVILGAGSATAVNGRLWIADSDEDAGTVEIGFGSTTSGAFADRNLSGCAVLGFLPGWRVSNPASTDNWLPDAGLALGVSRSPLNLGRTQNDADFKARGRFRDAVLSRSVIPVHVFTLNNPPLLDVAGYDEGVFFQAIDGRFRRSMIPFEDVLYEFEDGRFSWLEVGFVRHGVAAATSSLSFDAQGVVGLTLHPNVGDGYGLYVDAGGGALLPQVLGTDYLLSESPGVASLIDRVGAQVTFGSLGSFVSGGVAFSDADATFISSGVATGYRLKVLGGDPSVQGSYVVASVLSETTLHVEGGVPFSTAGSVVSWELYEGEPATGYDPGIVADVVYEQFNHLVSETFIVRVLSPLGETPADAAAQSSARLQAVVAEAVERGRAIAVRFEQDSGGPEAVVTPLLRTQLGVMSNGTLTVPSLSDPHFTTPAFEILVGTTHYTLGSNLTGVASFTDPLLGDQIEFGTSGSGVEGQLKFGVDTLADLDGSLTYYVQTFSDPSDLTAGSAEVDPLTGDINLSATDMTAYAGVYAYFVEQMITEDREDVVISPLQGALAFQRPLREFQLVETSYYQADVSGNRVLDSEGVPTLITEFLPLFVRMEEAAPITSMEYAINPSGRTVRADIPSKVWVANRLQNYGNVTTVTLDAADNVLRFKAPVTSAAKVLVNYAVNEAFGGEQGFTVSTVPVWRPPFFLLADKDTFVLETDRTADMEPGRLLRIGPSPFYVKASSYDVSTDATTVTLFPTPSQEAGSRAPGNDVLTLISSEPVTTSVDGVSTAGSPGFLLSLSASYEPVSKGMLSIVFRGDVTRFTVAGHLIEIGGTPLLSAGSKLSDDGLVTTVNVTTPFTRGFDPTVDSVKVSVRPIYPPGATQFIGLGAMVRTEPFEMVLYGEVDDAGDALPGRTLVLGMGYSIDETTGDTALLSPMQAPLAPHQKLLLSYTRLRTLAPILQDDMVVLPRYRAGFAHVTTPSKANGFLDAYLVGTYTFRSPDSFYVRTVSMPDWMGEVSKLAADRVASRTPHGGPVVVSGPATNNYQYGTTPVQSIERELRDQDRAARVFLSLYDTFIQAFEQVNETILGNVVGDRDGKFRFFVGRGKVYPGPGYEDGITGRLHSRFVWSQVFEAAGGSFGVAESDPIVDPSTATQDPTTLVVSGDMMNPWLLDFYVREQRDIVLNDMDDTILAGKDRVKLSFPFSFTVLGDFKRMWEPSVISRLYPEYTLAFTTTYPGLLSGTLPANPGVYSFLKRVGRPNLMKGDGPVFGSTFGQDIGDVSNPALGLITNITGQVKPRARLARARIWAYSATGFPELGGPSVPSVIATPLLLRDFPIDPTTGLPDLTRLAEQGGDLQDLSTGDYELSTPSWEPYDDGEGILPQVAFGRPTGDTYSVGYARGTLSDAFSGGFTFSEPVFKGIFVASRHFGCILTFTDGSSEITSAQDIVRIAEDGVTTLPFEPVNGDTIYVIPPGSADASGFSDPPTVDEMKQFAAQMPSLDVGVRERRSSFVDWSLPSIKDPSPFPIKEMVGQRSASPLQPIEADVEFVNNRSVPLEFPALLGEPTNDHGDYGIPYLSSTNTELERLGAVAPAFVSITQTDSPLPNAVYPDEIIGVDGSILSAASGVTPPATLLTSRDLTPVATAGVYTPHSGIGDVQSYDLLLVESGQANVASGVQGILSVGAVSAGTIEPPRFVSSSIALARTRYLFTNMMTHFTTTGSSGMDVQESGGVTTSFDISSVGGLFLNNGGGGVLGGLNGTVDNPLYGYPNNNIVRIQIVNPLTGLVVETITIQGNAATGGLGSVVMGAMPTFADKVLTVTGVGFVSFANLGGVAPGPVGPFDFLLTVDTYVSAPTLLTGSSTSYIGTDRLTFFEQVDLRTVLPRGSVTIGGVSSQGELSVYTVTATLTDTCTVNDPDSVNGGDPFTFLARDASAPNTIGTFDPSPGTEQGSVKVMGFEGHGNTPLPSTGAFTFSAVPSSDRDEAGPILTGLGQVYDTGVVGINPNSITSVIPSVGLLSSVEPGDVLIIGVSVLGDATTKAGTYLVRHAVEDTSTSGYDEVFATAGGGTSTGWVRSTFPTLVSSASGTLVISSVQSVVTSPTTHDWAAAGRVYLLVAAGDITQAVSREYTALVVGVDGTATLTLDTTDTTGLTSAGVYLSDAAFDALASSSAGCLVSGMAYLPLGQLAPSLPDNNVVGFDHGSTTAGGLVDVTCFNGAGTITFSFGLSLVTSPPAVDQLGVMVSDGSNTDTSVAFITDRSTPVYLDVPLYMDLSGIADTASTVYATIHPTAPAVRCVVPGDFFQTHDGASTVGTGFEAQAGVFLEPSFPRPTTDLGDGEVKVVDATHTVTSTDHIGMRSAGTYFAISPEPVTFQVRRIRRFHEVLDAVGANLAPLRFAYEIRTGTVDSYTGYILTAAGTGTQLGGFDDKDVNVNAGDVIRLLDGAGAVVDTAEVASVLSATSVRLRSPGFAVAPPSGGETFQVYLRQAPVPHQQSNEQLLDLITDQVLLTRTADPVGDTGGRATLVNEFRDNGIADFSTLTPALQVGDIVIVDPAGALAGPTGTAVPMESGSRPFGDQSVSTRTDGSHIPGSPSELDDNRGWYRIVSDPAATTSYLALSGETDFSGPDGSPVLLGSEVPTNQQFAVYPDITGSGLTGTTEGQMDFRPTHVADGSNSYQDGSFKSIEPISYRIIRPTSIVSEETVDLVLFLRERMLSWVEEMRTAMQGDKQGSYYVFQRDEHIADIGSPTDGDDGLGVPSNVYISSLSGLTQYAPFANTSDCLSVLDRRLWCLDTRLDREFPPYSAGTDPYSSLESDFSTSGYTIGSGRPVEPDRVSEVLDQSDQLRAMRYSWIKYRASQENGTLPSINRFLRELPRLLQEQEDNLRLQQSIKDSK